MHALSMLIGLGWEEERKLSSGGKVPGKGEVGRKVTNFPGRSVPATRKDWNGRPFSSPKGPTGDGAH
jgi:hypothetical protein